MKLNEVKNYLKIDNDITDDDAYIQTLMDTTLAYIVECCGSSYQSDASLSKLADLAQYKLINDLYINRSQYIDNGKKDVKDILITTIFDKLASASDEVVSNG